MTVSGRTATSFCRLSSTLPSPIKRGLLESLALLAQRINAEVIAEGVEKEEEFETLREMKVPFAQGYEGFAVI